MENQTWGAPSAPPAPLELGDAIASTFRIVGQSFVPFLVIALIVVVPATAIQTVIELVVYWATQQSLSSIGGPEEALSLMGMASAGYLVVLFILMVTYSLGQGAIMYLTIESMVGRKASAFDALRAVIGRLVPLVVCAFVVGIVTGIGTLFCLVPGVIAWVWLMAALPACLVERLGPIASMQRSIELTEGHRLTIFLIFLVLFGAFFGVTMCVSLPAGIAAGAQGAAGQIVQNPLAPMQIVVKLVTMVVQLGMTMVLAAATAVVYAKLRGLRDGVDAQALARVFA
ncbi:hypothetical protein [Sandaracinus amylolyticus]|uniref:hypothetical protein n=1 Tax=Sandaracinus amylolyticus TaxID=927083 RepID=UPI001F469A30|nr:hypothetical protein [Sandaracinus amylolyticus]